jgi:IgA-specific serine endopeptidase
VARPTKAQQQARKDAERKKLEQAITKAARIVGPWDKRKKRLREKEYNRKKYLRKLELRRLDAERKAERESPEYRAREAAKYLAQSLEYEARKQARLVELRAGAEANMDDMYLWDLDRNMEKNTPEWREAVALDAERRQAEQLGSIDAVDIEAARREMTRELNNREATRHEEEAEAAYSRLSVEVRLASTTNEDTIRALLKEQAEQQAEQRAAQQKAQTLGQYLDSMVQRATAKAKPRKRRNHHRKAVE